MLWRYYLNSFTLLDVLLVFVIALSRVIEVIIILLSIWWTERLENLLLRLLLELLLLLLYNLLLLLLNWIWLRWYRILCVLLRIQRVRIHVILMGINWILFRQQLFVQRWGVLRRIPLAIWWQFRGRRYSSIGESTVFELFCSEIDIHHRRIVLF